MIRDGAGTHASSFLRSLNDIGQLPGLPEASDSHQEPHTGFRAATVATQGNQAFSRKIPKFSNNEIFHSPRIFTPATLNARNMSFIDEIRVPLDQINTMRPLAMTKVVMHDGS